MFIAMKEAVTQCNSVASLCVLIVLCMGQRNNIYQALDAHNSLLVWCLQGNG